MKADIHLFNVGLYSEMESLDQNSRNRLLNKAIHFLFEQCVCYFYLKLFGILSDFCYDYGYIVIDFLSFQQVFFFLSQYDNILMEEAAQILEIETFIPLLLQVRNLGSQKKKESQEFKVIVPALHSWGIGFKWTQLHIFLSFI